MRWLYARLWPMPVLSHHSMANLLVLDPSMGKIWSNEHFYGCPLTKLTAMPLYYDYIDHIDALLLSTRLTAYPTTALVSSIHRGASCHDAPLNVWTKKISRGRISKSRKLKKNSKFISCSSALGPAESINFFFSF